MELSMLTKPTRLIHDLNTSKQQRHCAEALPSPQRGDPHYPTPPMSRTTTPKQEEPLTLSSAATVAPTTVVGAVQGNVYPLDTPDDVQPTPQGPEVESSVRPDAFDITQVSDEAGPATKPSDRQSRRAKAHVPSACINCKRAHLSCDIQRPCQRCIDTGKEATCIDVQHKKRGRPRLRETVEAGPSSTPQAPVRPIASTRSRRTGSFRSHQSQGSESSSMGFATPQRVTYSLPQVSPGYYAAPVAQELPTAILDLDLVVVRANQAFHRAVGSNSDLSMVRLADIAAPLDGEAFTTIRQRLRDERERHEPSYLPPIVPPGHRVLDHVQDSDVDILTRGFADNMYTWKPTGRQASDAPLMARVRLAKITSYFAVVTLPGAYITPATFGATVPHATSLATYPTHMQPDYIAAPPSTFYPVAATGPPQVSFAQTQQRMVEPYQTYMASTTGPPSSYYHPPGTAPAGLATTSIASIISTTDPESVSSTRPPRKRRRLGIDEVIQ